MRIRETEKFIARHPPDDRIAHRGHRGAGALPIEEIHLAKGIAHTEFRDRHRPVPTVAGDIQPWRNTHNADIRYIERVYPPRMELGYTLKDADGNVVSEGEETIADIAFDFNILAPIRSNSMSFFYEITLLEDWIRKTFRKLKSEAAKN